MRLTASLRNAVPRLAILALTIAMVPSPARAEDGSVLDGAAAIIDAGAPVAVSAIQASADKSIAAINAQAAVKMTQITANATKYIADDEAQVAIYQAMTAARINNIDQQGVTDRLSMQLAELRDARHEAEAAEREKMLIEFRYNEQRIALAKYQADQQAALARMQFGLQMTIAGVSGAFGYGNSARLTVTNAVPAQLRSQLAASGPGSGAGGSAGAGASGAPGSAGISAGTGGDATASRAQATASTSAIGGGSDDTTAASGAPASVSSRLLASVGPGPTTVLPNGNRVASRSVRLVRGAQKTPFDGDTIFVGDNLQAVMDKNGLVRGSYPGAPVRITPPLRPTPSSLKLVQADGIAHASSAARNGPAPNNHAAASGEDSDSHHGGDSGNATD
jgi:hypothetical protein